MYCILYPDEYCTQSIGEGEQEEEDEEEGEEEENSSEQEEEYNRKEEENEEEEEEGGILPERTSTDFFCVFVRTCVNKLYCAMEKCF